jgi:ribulose bisphosphate carboxylase small subunit
VSVNTHLNLLTRCIQKALQEAEAYLGVEWTIRCVESAFALEAARLDQHGHYVRAARFDAASRNSRCRKRVATPADNAKLSASAGMLERVAW